ncbi:MAG: hypothetical protein JNM93_07460 [Bacteriovoracaceae bacterium]|nr:hypothetical protein [Bacteriovoracaceae bacterium]
MKLFFMTCIFTMAFAYAFATHFNIIGMLQERSEVVTNFEVRALELSKENRALKVTINDLKYKLKEMEAQNSFLKLKQGTAKRTIASEEVVSIESKGGKDYVQYEVYQWSPEKLLAIGDKEFQYNNFEKSAQFFNELIKRFPAHQKVNDRVLFEAGIAAYESKKYYNWADEHLTKVVKDYPKSKFYRGAKLWLALSKLKQGQEKYFYETVEEFRMKYRNTEEWKILSKHYEEFTTKYKN